MLFLTLHTGTVPQVSSSSSSAECGSNTGRNTQHKHCTNTAIQKLEHSLHHHAKDLFFLLNHHCCRLSHNNNKYKDKILNTEYNIPTINTNTLPAPSSQWAPPPAPLQTFPSAEQSGRGQQALGHRLQEIVPPPTLQTSCSKYRIQKKTKQARTRTWFLLLGNRLLQISCSPPPTLQTSCSKIQNTNYKKNNKSARGHQALGYRLQDMVPPPSLQTSCSKYKI